MKIGMLTGIWWIAEKATLIESLQRAAALGFHYVDLHGVFHGGPQHLTLDERLAVKSELKSLGLIPRNYVIHPLHNLASANEAGLEQSLPDPSLGGVGGLRSHVRVAFRLVLQLRFPAHNDAGNRGI